MGVEGSQANEAGESVSMTGGRATILLVDDHELVRFGVKRMLEDLGLGQVIVHEAQSLAAAGRMFREHRDTVDLVILDLNLPDAKGLSGLRTFKHRFRTARVVVLSGSVDDAIASEALAMGAEAFLHKASETQLLRTTFSRIVEEIQSGSTRSFQVAAQVGAAGSAAKDKRMSLSPRELQILELLLQGCTNQEIAEATGLALGTAKNYISGIFSVFGVTSRSKLIALFH